jgi:hypothetical protein
LWLDVIKINRLFAIFANQAYIVTSLSERFKAIFMGFTAVLDFYPLIERLKIDQREQLRLGRRNFGICSD